MENTLVLRVYVVGGESANWLGWLSGTGVIVSEGESETPSIAVEGEC